MSRSIKENFNREELIQRYLKQEPVRSTYLKFSLSVNFNGRLNTISIETSNLLLRHFNLKLKAGDLLFDIVSSDYLEGFLRSFSTAIGGTSTNISLKSILPGKKIKFLFQPNIAEENNVILVGISEEEIGEYSVELTSENKDEAAQIFESLFNNHPDAIYSFDFEGYFTSANASALKLAEFSRDEMIDHNVMMDLIPWTDKERVISYFKKASKGTVQNYNTSFISFKGNYRIINITNFPIIINGVITGVFGIAKDITEAESIKKQANLLESSYKTILDQSLDVICTIDKNGFFLEINKACYNMWGYNAEELIGRNYLDFVLVDDKESTQDTASEIMQGEDKTNFSNRYIRKDGTIVPMVWSSRWVEEEQIYYSIAKNASEMNAVKHKLEEERNMLRAIIDYIPDYIFVKNRKHESILANKKFYNEYLGKDTEEEMLGLIPTDYFSEKEGQRIMEDNRMVMESELPVINRKDITVDHKGKKEVILLTKVPFKTAEGDVIGLVGIARNITESHEFEQEQLLVSNLINSLSRADNLKKGLLLSLQTISEYFDFDYAQAWDVGIRNNTFKEITNYKKQGNWVLSSEASEILESSNIPQKVFDSHKIEIIDNSYSKGKTTSGVFIGVPIIFDEKVIQILTFYVEKTHKDLDEIMIILNRLNLQISTYIQRKIVESQLNNILESITDGFFSITKDWIITYFNKEAENLLRVSKATILNKYLWDYFPEAKDSLSYKMYTKAFKTGEKVSFQDYFEPYDTWFEVNVYPSASGLSVYFKDITAKKKIDEEIKTAKERYDLVTKVTHEAIYDWDMPNNTLEWSKAYFSSFGYNIPTSDKGLDHWENQLHPDDKDKVISSLENALEDSSVNIWEYEYKLIKANKEISIVIDRGLITRNQKGIPIRMIGSLQDISELKQNEISLENLNTKLKLHADELAVSNAELEQFAYIASHDLQEPLRMVTSFLTQLNKKYKDQLDPKAQQYIFYATDGAIRMRLILLDLLEYSRVGRMDYKLEKVDLNIMLKDIIKLHADLILELNGKVLFEDLPTIYAAPSPTQRVISNLITNALKYQKKGNIPIIQITVEEDDEYWQINVKDNGIGIDEQFFDKIFVVFQRLHSKDEYSGTGIGLAICRKIIENHGGKIWVSSKINEGSTFHITIKKQF